MSQQIVTKVQLDDGVNCTDANGVTKDHLDEWSDDRDCTRNICFIAPSGQYIIKYVCREPLESELPDYENCRFIGNNSYSYPHCCPVLWCDERMEVTTTPAPACMDRASNLSCVVWQEDNGCDPGTDFYNFTWVYCRETCAFC